MTARTFTGSPRTGTSARSNVNSRLRCQRSSGPRSRRCALVAPTPEFMPVSRSSAFAAESSKNTARLHRSLTAMLGPEIVAYDAMVVPDDFSARFSALMRAYRYQVLQAPTPDPLRRLTTWHVPWSLDMAAMNTAAAQFVGEHEFASFCRQRPDRTTVRTVFNAEWVREGDVVEFRISARAFCQQMVRSITGFCVDVGRGKADPDTVSEVIEARHRNAAPRIAPSRGLVLWEVAYD